jgi:hypothetical protein
MAFAFGRLVLVAVMVTLIIVMMVIVVVVIIVVATMVLATAEIDYNRRSTITTMAVTVPPVAAPIHLMHDAGGGDAAGPRQG